MKAKIMYNGLVVNKIILNVRGDVKLKFFKFKFLYKALCLMVVVLILEGCNIEQSKVNGVKYEDKVKYKKSVSEYAREHLYELGDITDEIESLSKARNKVVRSRKSSVEFEYDDYKDSSVYNKYKKVSKNNKQEKEFNKITKVRKKVLKASKKIIDSDVRDSEEYAEEFIEKYRDKDEDFINKLYLKYSQ